MASLNDTLLYLNDSKFLLLHDAILLTSLVCINKNALSTGALHGHSQRVTIPDAVEI
jgi:hypothetical protein